MVILQAMAAGVPVVSTDVGGIRYLVEDGRSGFLAPARDSHRLAGSMQSIVGDSDLAAAMGRRAREIAEDRLRSDDIAGRTKAVYERALAAARK